MSKGEIVLLKWLIKSSISPDSFLGAAPRLRRMFDWRVRLQNFERAALSLRDHFQADILDGV